MVSAPTKYQAPVGVLIERLRQHYVFPDVGEQIAAHIKEKFDAGAYESVDDEAKLAEVLSKDLLAVNNDGHLGVRFQNEEFEEDSQPCVEESLPIDEEDPISEMWSGGGLINYGVKRVEVLKGGVGLLELQGFFPLAVAGPMITAAFTLLANTSALIIDLRANFGGDGECGDFVLSHLVPRAIHTNDVYWRPSNKTQQLRTFSYVSAPRYLAKRPVYVLTSERTFSCAEKFSGTAQALGRAVVIGENTGGGGHPCHWFKMSKHLQASISIGCTTNRALGRGWEGVGVKPDVECKPESVLDVAYRMALQGIEGQEALGHIGRMVAKDRNTELEKLEESLKDLAVTDPRRTGDAKDL
ncbi:ClpP/crotonase-like domain-containing protein [Fimicolochytrium jonesii]|uniref:ClpP/crotonase-like domain-containing protein n=1 Tax=Fimicolochytrium jonesii TaxID=1396493 RepID=UPI0022FDD6DF|nr:ClpP/crotonase-like domain-containing protein [Fimicolochytrium jonesii]KAI8818595.1 ClpP/crotonase-like domain-containing protein [Fimicolochytrium jonesii]